MYMLRAKLFFPIAIECTNSRAMRSPQGSVGEARLTALLVGVCLSITSACAVRVEDPSEDEEKRGDVHTQLLMLK